MLYIVEARNEGKLIYRGFSKDVKNARDAIQEVIESFKGWEGSDVMFDTINASVADARLKK